MRSSRVVALALVVGTFFVTQEVLTDLAAGRPVRGIGISIGDVEVSRDAARLRVERRDDEDIVELARPARSSHTG
jgi:hypothetical protein